MFIEFKLILIEKAILTKRMDKIVKNFKNVE